MQVSFSTTLALCVAMAYAPRGAEAQLTPTLQPPSGPELDDGTKAYFAHHRALYDRYHEQARRELVAEAGSRPDLYAAAAAGLRSRGGDIFQLQRVEVTGFWSSSPDEVEAKYAPYFNQRVALSHTQAPAGAAGMLKRVSTGLWQAWDYVRDAWSEVRYDRRSILSTRVAERLRPLEGVMVREIWAHSWATDAIYNAVLYSRVLPPKRLVLIGVPTRNVEKWRAFAHATGTEVLIYGFDQDFVSRTYAIDLPGLERFWLSADDFPGALPQKASDLALTWNGWVLEKTRSQRGPGRKPGEVSVLWTLPDGTVPWHMRGDYYDYFIDTLSWVQSVGALSQQQERLIQTEVERLENERAATLEKNDPNPPPPFQWGAVAAVRIEPVVAAAQATRVDNLPCVIATLEAVCGSPYPLDRLPSRCTWGSTVLHASTEDLSEASRRATEGRCPRDLADAMIRNRTFQNSYGFYSLNEINQIVAATRVTPPAPARSVADPDCREECRTDVDCGSITYKEVCVSGACFQVPRQQCSPRRVCERVCRQP